MATTEAPKKAATQPAMSLDPAPPLPSVPPTRVEPQTDAEADGVVLDQEALAALKVPRHFITYRDEKPYIMYGGLVWLLHEQSKGAFTISTELVQIPTEDNHNVAIVRSHVAILDLKDHKTILRECSELGDASAVSTNRMIAPHIVRMAATRAKARAIRDLVNVGVAALEELGGDPDAHERQQPRQQERSTAARVIGNARPQGPNGQVSRPPQPSGQRGAVVRRAEPKPQPKPQEETITVGTGEGTKRLTRPQIIERYNLWIGRLAELGYELEERLPDEAPLQEIVDHTKELFDAFKQAKEEGTEPDHGG